MEMQVAEKFDADVIVVGGGPVGLLMGAELALGGASVLVLERTIKANDTIKAGSINIASAEILARRGLLEKAREAHQGGVRKLAELLGKTQGLDPEMALAMANRRALRAGHYAAIPLDNEKLNLANLDVAGHSQASDATLILQREIEALLAEYAASLGVPVRRGIEVTGVEQSSNSVTLHTDSGDFRARYVVGCDGGRSLIRHALGFDFPGSDPEITGRQAVAELEGSSQLKFGWNWSIRGVYRYGPMPGTILTVEFDGPPADRTSAVTAAELQNSLQRTSGTDVRVTQLHGQATRWTDNARQVGTYRAGRVFLAGDAAHVHSPFSGQGLNLGMGDATNLGWKLGAAIAGWAPEGLLDTYNFERHPVGEWVLNWTRAQIALMRPDPKVAQLRNVVAQLMETSDGMTYMINKISGVTQRIGLPADGPLLGRIIPDIKFADGSFLHPVFVDGKFVLLDQTLGSPFLAAAAPWKERAVLLAGTFNSPVTDAVAILARPDGVVVWAAMPGKPVEVDCLTTALRKWAGEPT